MHPLNRPDMTRGTNSAAWKNPAKRALWLANLQAGQRKRFDAMSHDEKRTLTTAAIAKPPSPQARGVGSKRAWSVVSIDERKARVAAMREAGLAPDVEAKRKSAVLASWTPERIEREKPLMKAKRALVSREALRRGGAAAARVCATKRPTSIERAMAALLTTLSIEYKQQFQIGAYVADFYLPSRNLVIECDGEYWHSRPGVRDKDEIRDVFMCEHGYRVIRFGGKEITAMSQSDLIARIAK